MADDNLTAILAEIRERAAKATPGPWKVDVEHGYDIDGDLWRLPSVTSPDGKDVILSGHVDDPAKDLKFSAHARTDVPRLLAALDAVLAPHAPRNEVIYGRSCITHRPLKPVPDCELCTQDERREVCPECRDQFGDPVPSGDCRVRKAVLAALTGKEASDGR